MRKTRILILAVVATHWIVAIWHLFLAANVMPAPNNHVSGLAITLITSGHLLVAAALWRLSDKFAGSVLLIFFVAAMSADLYEHFLHASANNVFMMPHGEWTVLFDVSVYILLVLEILGCFAAVWLFTGGGRNSLDKEKSTTHLPQAKTGKSSQQFMLNIG